MRYILSILFIIFSIGVFGADTVRIDNAASMTVGGFTTDSFTLGSDSPNGDATTEAAPAKVYLPIQSGDGNLDYSILKVDSLYDITSVSHVVTYPLLVTLGSTSKYVYAAVKYSPLGASFYVTAKSSLIAANQTGVAAYFNLTAKNICKPITANGNSGCANLVPGSTTETTIKPIIYFFLSSDVLDVSGATIVDPAVLNGGVYFETQMSNRIFKATALKTSITDLKIGDGRFIIDFQANAVMDTTVFNQVIAYKYSNTSAVVSGNTYGSLGSGSLTLDVSRAQSGQFTLKGLSNGSAQNIAIAFLDKFLFATTFSDSKIGTPVEIQELLKKQACFLLTAGFGEEHYIINFFRLYRDQVLANTWAGQKFIHAYYKYAPKYALIIYKSEPIRLVIRSAAYCLYFIFNFYWIVLLAFFLQFIIYLPRNKNKIS